MTVSAPVRVEPEAADAMVVSRSRSARVRVNLVTSPCLSCAGTDPSSHVASTHRVDLQQILLHKSSMVLSWQR